MLHNLFNTHVVNVVLNIIHFCTISIQVIHLCFNTIVVNVIQWAYTPTQHLISGWTRGVKSYFKHARIIKVVCCQFVVWREKLYMGLVLHTLSHEAIEIVPKGG